MDNWFWYYWFLPSTLAGFSYENVWVLYTLALIPVLFVLRWLFFFKFRQKIEFGFFNQQHIKTDKTAWLRFAPDLIMSIAISLILLAWARPQRSNQTIEQESKGIDIMLLIDISESMKVEDFKPNRLEAAKKVAQDFVAGRTTDRLGLVLFAGEAYSLSPLTIDYQLINQYLADIDFDMINKAGTAIGSALGVGINRMLESKSQTKVMILLSDGENTAGNIDPITAAELAKSYGIKIYTIAVGLDGKVPYGKDIFGNTQYIENTLDETTLRKIAQIGDGKFFRASNNMALQEVFLRIDKYEKSEIVETRYRDTKDFFQIYLKWAMVFWLIWLLLKSSMLNNPFED